MKDLKLAAVAACKKEIKERIAVHQEKLDEINESIETNETKHGYDNDDSQGELLGDFERYAQLRQEHEDMLITFRNIDFHGGKKTVQEGAIVKIEDKIVLISVPMGELSLTEDHKKVYAISNEAPIFKAMKGLSEGDSFSFNEKNQKVSEIY
jgi:transcription elongation GreA/GreB family factor